MSLRRRMGRLERRFSPGRVGCTVCGRACDEGLVAWSREPIFVNYAKGTVRPCLPRTCEACDGALSPDGVPIQRQIIIVEDALAERPPWPEVVLEVERAEEEAEQRQRRNQAGLHGLGSK